MRIVRPRVSVIGAGQVGSAIVAALAATRVPLKIVLLDRTRAKAEGRLWDTEDALAFSAEHTMVPTDDYADVAGSDVVVIAAGSRDLPGESCPAPAGRNAATVGAIVDQLDDVAPHAVVIVVSSPVDVMTRIALETSRRDPRLIFGSGTLLDAVRLRLQLARTFGVALADVDAMVIGRHGRGGVPVWSRATIAGAPILERSTAAQRDACMAAALRREDAILARSGCASTAIALCVKEMVESVLADDGAAYPVSVRPGPAYEISPSVVLGLPCALGRGGVREQCAVPLTDEELFALGLSAATLIGEYESVVGDGAFAV